jgi:two-component system sensor histidine kinase/response regulator
LQVLEYVPEIAYFGLEINQYSMKLFDQSMLPARENRNSPLHVVKKDQDNRLWQQYIKHHLLNASKGIQSARKTISRIATNIKSLGVTESMGEYEVRKLNKFNLLNFYQLVTGILIPLTGLFDKVKIPASEWLLISLPACVSLLVLILNAYRKSEHAVILYFMLYPIVTSVVYFGGINMGPELFYILYGILSVFFLQEFSHVLFSVSFSMISYFILAVVWKAFKYQLETSTPILFLTNQGLAIIFIFYGLILIKKENSGYQQSMLTKNDDLNRKNIEIEQQKEVIGEKADLLKLQTDELTRLNTLKNKLFSVIAHDLKSPMYALQNIFSNIHQNNLPPEEIKMLVPDVLNDLTYTTCLMENLLQWAKSQMRPEAIDPETLMLSSIVDELLPVYYSQAGTKKIVIKSEIPETATVKADKGMISLVLRNLLSNAIKFTKNEGTISIGATQENGRMKIFVKDSGVGIGAGDMEKINRNNYYSTNGTASETGTGLGLMLCKDFLARNGSRLQVESMPGKGSTFSFELDRE